MAALCLTSTGSLDAPDVLLALGQTRVHDTTGTPLAAVRVVADSNGVLSAHLSCLSHTKALLVQRDGQGTFEVLQRGIRSVLQIGQEFTLVSADSPIMPDDPELSYMLTAAAAQVALPPQAATQLASPPNVSDSQPAQYIKPDPGAVEPPSQPIMAQQATAPMAVPFDNSPHSTPLPAAGASVMASGSSSPADATPTADGDSSPAADMPPAAPDAVAVKPEPGLPPLPALPLAPAAPALARQRSTRDDGTAPATAAAAAAKSVLEGCGAVVSDVRGLLFDASKPAWPDKTPFSRLAGKEMAGLWHKELEGLKEKLELPGVIIGVVGDTGAGKSSLLNALLGEADILPTNGMRACTASVVVTSYAEHSLYAAEVEFMTRDECEYMIKGCLADLVDEETGAVSLDTASERLRGDSERGAAQAMLEAIFGQTFIRSNELTLERLMSNNNQVMRLLGTTKEIRQYNAKDFRKEIGKFVDSNNKGGGVMQAWPLVKLCRLQHNWKLLSGGAVLVDLPGVRDANAARGRVAEAFLRRCDAVWVVAAIQRAVDNKTARELLGSTFRRQMLMDGQYSNITFVATKTDDIQVSDTVSALGAEEVCERSGTPLQDFYALEQHLLSLHETEQMLAAERRKNRSQYKKTRLRLSKLHDRLPIIARLQQLAQENEGTLPADAAITVKTEFVASAKAQASADRAAKRGGAAGRAGGRSSRRADDSDDDDDFIDDEEDKEDGSDDEWGGEGEDKEQSEDAEMEEDAMEEQEDSEGEDSDDGSDSGDDSGDSDWDADTPAKRKRGRSDPWSGSGSRKRARGDVVMPAHIAKAHRELVALRTFEALTAAEADVRNSIKNDTQEMSERRKRGTDLKAQAHTNAESLRKGQVNMNTICARARNSYSRERLQADFKEGVAAMNESANGDQQKDASALELPVFCISSRDAQKIEKRAARDGKPSAFKFIEDTGLPALRAHVAATASDGRAALLAGLAGGVSHFVVSAGKALLNQSCSTDEMSPMIQAQGTEWRRLLAKNLDAECDQWQAGLQTAWLQNGLKPRLAVGAVQAELDAMSTQRQWGASRRDDPPGLAWATYRATVTRNGVFRSPRAGEINFNGDLTKPMFDTITITWDATFNQNFGVRVGQLLDSCLRLLDSSLEDFMGALAAVPQLQKEGLRQLTAQIHANEERRLLKLKDTVMTLVETKQRELSRDYLEPSVKDSMVPAYQTCAAERGSGCYSRMKGHMERHVLHEHGHMFKEAAEQLVEGVEELMAEVLQKLREGLAGMVQGAQTHLSTLWELAPCARAERIAAASSLHALAVRMQPICATAKAHYAAPFELPPSLVADAGASGSGSGSVGVKAEPGMQEEEAPKHNVKQEDTAGEEQQQQVRALLQQQLLQHQALLQQEQLEQEQLQQQAMVQQQQAMLLTLQQLQALQQFQALQQSLHQGVKQESQEQQQEGGVPFTEGAGDAAGSAAGAAGSAGAAAGSAGDVEMEQVDVQQDIQQGMQQGLEENENMQEQEGLSLAPPADGDALADATGSLNCSRDQQGHGGPMADKEQTRMSAIAPQP